MGRRSNPRGEFDTDHVTREAEVSGRHFFFFLSAGKFFYGNNEANSPGK